MIDEQRIFLEATQALLANRALAELHQAVGTLQSELKNDPNPLQTLAGRSDPAAIVVRLQVGGYFDPGKRIPPRNLPAVDPATDLGFLCVCSPAEQAQLSMLPSVEAILQAVQARATAAPIGGAAHPSFPPGPRNTPGHDGPPAVVRSAQQTTFLFLADPQPNRCCGQDSMNPRVEAISRLNACLNGIEGMTWPTTFGLTCGGQPIGPIAGVFFGGDLCQTGGGYNMTDQVVRAPFS